MTTLATEPRVPTADSGDDDLFHYFCCDPDVALCGADLSETEFVTELRDGELICVVCADLDRDDFDCRLCRP